LLNLNNCTWYFELSLLLSGHHIEDLDTDSGRGSK
jgi:hypothetical protein